MSPSSDPGGSARVVGRAPDRPPLLLASTSPQRNAILEQLRIPFLAVTPRYAEEDGKAGLPPVELVRAHARGKAKSVLAEAGGRPVLAVDTAVVCHGQTLGKPEGPLQAKAMLRLLSGRWHEVVSAVCLLTDEGEAVEHAVTRVLFRPLTAKDIDGYVASGEWQGRAGGYAVQGLGASLVERIDGDYLNVVGLPGRLLCRLLEERLGEAYGLPSRGSAAVSAA